MSFETRQLIARFILLAAGGGMYALYGFDAALGYAAAFAVAILVRENILR